MAVLGQLELTWARLANGTDQLAGGKLSGFGIAPSNRGWWTGPLPDIALVPQSYVTVERLSTNASAHVTCRSVHVVVTRNPNTDQAQQVDIVPLLTPLPVAGLD